jgi:hypothetical protein
MIFRCAGLSAGAGDHPSGCISSTSQLKNHDTVWPWCLKVVRTRQGQYDGRVDRGPHSDAWPWPAEDNDSTQLWASHDMSQCIEARVVRDAVRPTCRCRSVSRPRYLSLDNAQIKHGRLHIPVLSAMFGDNQRLCAGVDQARVAVSRPPRRLEPQPDCMRHLCEVKRHELGNRCGSRRRAGRDSRQRR